MPRRPRRLLTIALDAEHHDLLAEDARLNDRIVDQQARVLLVDVLKERKAKRDASEPVTADVA